MADTIHKVGEGMYELMPYIHVLMFYFYVLMFFATCLTFFATWRFLDDVIRSRGLR